MELFLPDGTATAARPEREVPNLRHLRLLEAAVRLTSLTQAAEAVHLSQPAASQAVARLEAWFGAQLLERTSEGVSATHSGLLVQARTLRALAHLTEMGRRVARAKPAESGAPPSVERHMTSAQLRALVGFAEAGSFSAAARGLQQTESAVQRTARALEQLVGLPLFVGATRGLRLSPLGEGIATHAALALKEISAARDEVLEHRGTFAGRLVIGTLPLPRTRIVPDAVVTLIHRYPAARIEIIDGTYQALVRAVRSGACDLIVGALREGRCPIGLVEKPLFTDRLSIVARAGHPLCQQPVTPKMLAAFPWVLPRRDTPARGIFERLLGGQDGIDPERGYVETGSLVAARGILLASDAISILSAHQIDYELRQGLLRLLDVALPENARRIGYTTRADWRPTSLQSAFIAALATTAEAAQQGQG
jgi:LysR family transcriptional regulator, regulator for genes of the gallate degradation pathway